MAMGGQERREQILKILKNSDKPVAGTELAKQLQVSRQVIVQDIALLRAIDKNILSTNKGNFVYQPWLCYRRREDSQSCV